MESSENGNTSDRGLGDTIKRATTALGIRPCEPCKQRAERLNRLVPYPWTKANQDSAAPDSE